VDREVETVEGAAIVQRAIASFVLLVLERKTEDTPIPVGEPGRSSETTRTAFKKLTGTGPVLPVVEAADGLEVAPVSAVVCRTWFAALCTVSVWRCGGYRSGDVEGCRTLYAQLVEHHRRIYDDPTIGRDDPGAGFDEYMVLPERVMTWVAVEGNAIVGLAGLLWEGGESTIEPVIVDRACRRRGVATRLLAAAVDEPRRRGASDVNIKPVARNASAIAAFHELGFRIVGHVQLFMSLNRDNSYWPAGPELFRRRFDC
jgi:GNAT superfamily N-acetyltransferase